MNKIVFVAILFVFTGFAFGQQALWSTVEKKDTAENNCIKYVPYDSVTNEVLEFYDLYKFYFDYTGYNKENFKEKLKANYLKYSNGDLKDWNWIYDIKEKTVVAFRIPIEKGSAIVVICIDNNNFHMVIFSNVYNAGANMTYNGELENDKTRFEKWFKTLLN